MRVWIDQDLCTGDGLCEEIAPDVFVLLDDGLAYVREGDKIYAEEKGNPQGAAGVATVPAGQEDIAIESAGIVLASDDPRGVVAVRKLSQAGYRKMVQNLAWATGYNVLAIPLAAGALAWAGIVLPPAAAAVLMSASTVIVAINAQFLRRLQLRPTTAGP